MTAWWIDRMLPSLVAGGGVALAGYLRLHFAKTWPYWGRRHGDQK